MSDELFRRIQVQHNIDFKICNEQTIELVNETKSLGVIFDYKINFSSHVSYVQQKLSKGTAILCKYSI